MTRQTTARLTRVAAALCTAGLVAACATPPQSAPKPAPPAAPEAASPAPVEPPAPAPAAPPPPASAAEQQQATKIALAAVELLEAGHEDKAKAEIARALAIDAYNKLALNLQRQIAADPQAVLGRDAFNYTVKPGETLSRIAGRFLNDIYAFYLLARYNGIAVPRQVAGGQVLRIPGKAPPPAALDKPAPPVSLAAAPPPAPMPAPAPVPEESPGQKAMKAGRTAEGKGDFERALAEYGRAGQLDQPDAGARADAVRKQLVLRYTASARRASAKQDLAGAIGAWDRVLELEPQNDAARLERQKAAALKKRLDTL